MKNDLKQIFARVSFTVVSNVVSLMVSTLIILIVPKFLTTVQYGYFQLYIFYTGYIGFANLGWPEGIMLRYGGRKYDELDKPSLKTQLMVFSGVSTALGAGLCILALCLSGADKLWVFIGVGLCILVFLPRAFMQVLLHMTNRTYEYARGMIIEKAVYFAAVILMLLAGVRNYYWLILAELLGRAAALVYIALQNRTLLRAKLVRVSSLKGEIFENVRTGIKLMLANLVGLFLIGIVRQSIEWNWDVETFGRVSLTLSVSNLLMVFIRAVSVVLFPTLKTTEEGRLPSIYRTLRTGLMFVLFAMLAAYFPLRAILSAWLPQYAASLKYMALLFPMCVFECKMSMLVETYMKTLRMERQLLAVNIVSVALSLLLSGVTVFVLNSLELAVLSILVLVAVRCIAAELLVAPRLGIPIGADAALEAGMVIVFVCMGWMVGGFAGFGLYCAAYASYLLLKRREVRGMLAVVRTSLKGK